MKKITLLCSILSVGFILQAQPFTLNPKIKPLELKLETYPTTKAIEKGQFNLIAVNQKSDTLYYFLKGISILSPIVITATSTDKSKKLFVSLHKDLWSEVEKQGSTDADGIWTSSFKTGGELGIAIAAKKATDYTLFVWIGDEPPLSMPIIFKKHTGTKKTNN